METIGTAFLKRNGHLVEHRFDPAAKCWTPIAPIPPRAPKAFRPMLAERLTGEIAFPVYAQPKLDGVRCVARAEGLFSRDGKTRFVSTPHVEAALAPLFAADPLLVLDGELWAADLDLAEIAGLARRSAPAPAIAFYVFDLASSDPFEDRTKRVAELVALAGSEAVALVETTPIADREALDAHYRHALAAGFEGQMIRLPRAPYGRGRVADMLKRKPEEDAEAEIVGVEVGEGGKVTLALRVSCEVFKAPAPLKEKDRRRIARIGAGLVGLEATYRFTGLLPSGAPRDPIVKAIHETPRL